MRSAYRAATVLVAIGYLVALIVLAHEQSGLPPHEDVTLPGDIPATFYMPGTENQPGPGDPFYHLFALPPEQRPPGVVLVHGFTSDRVNVSTLARRIAQNGYGVLAIDVRGHGENRNPFNRELLRDDIDAAAAYLRRSSLVDPSRIVVIGHSMGAGATLDYATRNNDLTASVMISGGFALDGPVHPRNSLFIFAENDLPFAPLLSNLIGAHLAGVDHVDLDKRYGDFSSGNALELVQVPKVNHVTILWSPVTAQRIIEWLDAACGVKRASAVNLADPRLNTILLVLLLFLILMFPLGRVSGGLAVVRDLPPSSITGAIIGLAVLTIALFAAMPLISIVPPASFISLVVGNSAVSWIAIAGGMLIAFVAIQFPAGLRALAPNKTRSLLVAGLAFAAIYVMSVYDVTLHRATLMPERFLTMIASALLVLPFFLAFEVLMRRGRIGRATLVSTAGFLTVFIVMLAGLALASIPFGIAPFSIFILFLMMQIFATGVYSVSGDLLLIAAVESLWYARLFAMVMPITFKL
jgi:dienelactone hydrolase